MASMLASMGFPAELAMMAAGATPRQIDARMHWVPGRAREILTERWKREGET